MKQSWQKGWPKGTRVKMVSEHLREEYQGREAVISRELYFDEQTDAMSYLVFCNGLELRIAAHWLALVAFPVPIQNRARNFVRRLVEEVDPVVANQIGCEQQWGEFPQY